jgi:hypothetical protein
MVVPGCGGEGRADATWFPGALTWRRSEASAWRRSEVPAWRRTQRMKRRACSGGCTVEVEEEEERVYGGEMTRLGFRGSSTIGMMMSSMPVATVVMPVATDY